MPEFNKFEAASAAFLFKWVKGLKERIKGV